MQVLGLHKCIQDYAHSITPLYCLDMWLYFRRISKIGSLGSYVRLRATILGPWADEEIVQVTEQSDKLADT